MQKDRQTLTKKFFGELRRAAVQRACCFLGILMTIDKEEMLCSMI